MTNKDLQKKIEELENAATYLLKIATDLKAMTSVSTEVLKRKPVQTERERIRAEMRVKYRGRIGNKKAPGKGK